MKSRTPLSARLLPHARQRPDHASQHDEDQTKGSSASYGPAAAASAKKRESMLPLYASFAGYCLR